LRHTLSSSRGPEIDFFETDFFALAAPILGPTFDHVAGDVYPHQWLARGAFTPYIRRRSRPGNGNGDAMLPFNK
jgi:hypothetical protein